MSLLNNGPLSRIKDLLSTNNNREDGTAISEVINSIGAEHIKLLLPFTETAPPFYDFLNKRISFESNGTVKNGGPTGRYLDYDNNYLKEKERGGFKGPQEPTYSQKYATKIDISEINRIGKISAYLKRQGDETGAVVKMHIARDNAGSPGDPVVYEDGFVDLSKDYQSMGGIYQFARWHGFPIHPALPVDHNTLDPDNDYWLVMEYDVDTGVDESNYISWTYGSNVGGARATYDGTTWTVINDETHAYKLYSNDLCLYGDFSLFVTFQINDFTATRTPIITMPSLLSSTSLTLAIVSNRFMTYLLDEAGFLIFGNAGDYSSRGVFNEGWNTLCLTFSKEKAEDKVRIYNNGKFISEIKQDNERTWNGYRGAALSPPDLYSHPWNFGVHRHRNRETSLENNNIRFASIMLTDNELSESKIAEVTNLLNRNQLKQ